MSEALDLKITGVVQGVGFRPFVYRVAQQYGITGWVRNAIEGVLVHAEGSEQALDQFVIALVEQAPAAAQVKEIALDEVPAEGFSAFEIRFSQDSRFDETTLVSPDLATCDACVAELFDPEDRRYRYPFINCTNCGPRFTIMRELPYDRPATSMEPFTMCSACQTEYDDPGDRRFHAQPDACFDCGPHLGWIAQPGVEGITEGVAENIDAVIAENAAPGALGGIAQGVGSNPIEGAIEDVVANYQPLAVEDIAWAHSREESDELIARAVALIQRGGIVAVKGLGGYHLVCDASNEQALARLRKRKHREGKAFAVMVANVDAVRDSCLVSEVEAQQLQLPARPIVLLRKRAGVQFAAGLADGLPELGVMLPTTPVQHILAHDFGGMLVMTSGNIHDEPIVTTEADALQQLALVADAFLVNDRAIEGRYDDSVLRVIDAGPAGEVVQMIRRARGYAPLPLSILQPQGEQPHNEQSQGDSDTSETDDHGADAHAAIPTASCDRGSEVFATGPEQKNTFTFVRGDQAFVSQHIGDMESVAVMDAWHETRTRFAQLFRLQPDCVVCDYHPEYLTTKWALTQSLPVHQVQHHHAHILSVMGENALTDPVCGFAFDGTGYGMDGALWGGEVLLSNLQAFERFANFAYIPLPGGAAAIKEPTRIAYGALWAFDLLDHEQAHRFVEEHVPDAEMYEQMIERGLNTPLSSSVGRLFDAASALLGLCEHPRYEGEAAILLEAAITQAPNAAAHLMSDESSGNEHGGEEAIDNRYTIDIIKNTATENSTAQDTSVVLMDPAPVFEALLDDMQAGVPTHIVARRFHDAFVQAIVTAAELVRALYDISVVALAGGVFMNRYLIEHVLEQLQQHGFTVALNRDLPPNDASISYGQAVLGLQAQMKE